VAILQAEGTPVTCRVIGDGPEKAALHAQAEALGLSQAVDFRHDVHRQADVFALVKAATAFVFPSAREGFGIAVLEALACGVPVITTSAPENLAQHLAARSSRGVICDPSASGLAKAMRSLLAEAGSPAGIPGWTGEDSWLSEYSWDVTADQVSRAFQI
jgi:glycosyltransferase involved in cell wall biosynthesis